MEILNHQGLFGQVQGNFEFRRYTDNNGLVNSSGKVFLIQRIDGSNFSNILHVSENLKILRQLLKQRIFVLYLSFVYRILTNSVNSRVYNFCAELRVWWKCYIFLHLSPTKFDRKWPQFHVFFLIKDWRSTCEIIDNWIILQFNLFHM